MSLTPIEKLLVVQDRDRQILQLARERTDVPQRKQEIESRLEAHKAALEEVRNDLKKKTAAVKETEIEVQSCQQRITKLREQQLQIKNNTEYRALESEIATVQREISGLEDQQLGLMEQADQIRGTAAERERDLAKEKAQVDQEVAVLGRRAQELETQAEALKTERAELAKDVDAGLLGRYERILQKVGGTALVPVEHGACGGCHMQLPPSVVNDAKRNTGQTGCNFCGRILYFPS